MTVQTAAKEIAEGIDFIGGTLNAMAGRDATTVTLDIVKKDLAVGMDLMSDVVLHPTFRAEELERQRQQLLSTLQVQYSDADYLATLVFARTVYGASPYGLPPEGTPATVPKFQPGDFVKFHDANYAPNQSLLGFAGDITPEEAFAVAEKYFGGWPKVDVPLTEPQPPGASAAQHIWLIDKPDAVQTQIRIGKIAIPRNDPDYLPLQHAQFATHQLWATQYRDGEFYAAGDYPNQGPIGDGLPKYIANGEDISAKDLVVWYTMGFTHVPEVEEYPVILK